jgi:hypothetical protein
MALAVAGSDHNLALNQNDDLFGDVSIVDPFDFGGELKDRAAHTYGRERGFDGVAGGVLRASDEPKGAAPCLDNDIAATLRIIDEAIKLDFCVGSYGQTRLVKK